MNKLNDRRAIYRKVIDINGQHDPWIIMVHGFTHSCKYFSAQVSEFQKNFRIFLTDLRGHGKSTSAAGPYGIEEYADDILMAIDEVGIEKAHYWGTHTGSAIGLVLALRQPKRFSSLVLEGTFLPGFPMPRTMELINRARSVARSAGIAVALEEWFNKADWFAYIREHPQTCRAAEHRAMIFEFAGMPWLSDLTPRPVSPVSDCLANILPPALIYNGKHDLDDFKQAAVQLANNLCKAQREEISGAGSFPGWEYPHAVNRIVHSFLTGQAC